MEAKAIKLRFRGQIIEIKTEFNYRSRYREQNLMYSTRVNLIAFKYLAKDPLILRGQVYNRVGRRPSIMKNTIDKTFEGFIEINEKVLIKEDRAKLFIDPQTFRDYIIRLGQITTVSIKKIEGS